MKKAFGFLHKNPEIIFFICAFLLWTALMCWSNSNEGGDFSWHDLKVEANGMIFDLFVFGILVTVYNAIRDRKEKIERFKEEIDDYREWDEKEAMYRIVGAIKRLTKVGVFNIDLQFCYLEEAKLENEVLNGAIFNNAKLAKARLNGAKLNDAQFISASMKQAYLNDAQLTRANFRGATLSGSLFDSANLEKAILRSANLEGAYLVGANLKGADIRHVKWEGAVVSEDWIELLNKCQVIGYQEFCNTFKITQKGDEYHIHVKEGAPYPLH
jgi:hypothetical protein